jgi:hypothetical protein
MRRLLAADPYGQEARQSWQAQGTKRLDQWPKLPSPIALALNHHNFIPVEAFKGVSPDLNPNSQVERVFRSSGTTQADRSRVALSQQGYHQYCEQAMISFYGCLRRYTPQPLTLPGVSLIPFADEWPDSSLAQMLTWISHISSVSHEQPLAQIKHLSARQTPFWLFGTGFHYAQLFDQGLRQPLPAGSLVVETGGTKGLTRDLTSQELHSMLSDMFQVTPEQIITEYGMSELSCQAYSCPALKPPNHSPQWLQFPAWVATAVETPEGLQPEGEGALVVWDQYNPDYPWPVRTQDRVHLQSDGRFQLLGRILAAPLKGCSLRAAQVFATPSPEPTALETAQQKTSATMTWHTPPTTEAMQQRADQLFANWPSWLDDSEWAESAAREWPQKVVRQWVHADLMPPPHRSSTDWVQAALTACDHGPTAKRWLILGPQSHPLALIEPLVLAYLLDLDVEVRLTRPQPSLETWLIERLNSVGARIRTRPRSWRLGSQTPVEWDAIMVFGSDDTIDQLTNLNLAPVKGFGTLITVATAPVDALTQDPTPLIKDAFTLGQQGCLCPRLGFVWDDDTIDQDSWQTTMAHALEQALNPLDLELNLDQALALRHETSRLALQKRTSGLIQPSAREPLFPVYLFQPDWTVDDYMSPTPWSLPLVRVKPGQQDQVSHWLTRHPSIQRVSLLGKAPKEIVTQRGLELCRAGEANQNLWTGQHQQQAYFRINKSEGGRI